ncbi:MAG: GYF domain-containing protein [Chthoniobacterales bacterium]|nr:GYF domain-containing protein [Chthoniobacterales bacterium]MCX7712745.1 GYF domain-containing protein [Chthoniobacterales bacterium]
MANIYSENWYLRKHDDGSIFGPVPFSKLQEWARSAQISPHDMVSEDQVVWNKAPMIPELNMDYLVQVTDDVYYGPSTEQAVMEFYKLGEISSSTLVINCVTGDVRPLEDWHFFPAEARSAKKTDEDVTIESLHNRVRDLERNLLEYHRRFMSVEEQVRRLERRLQALEGGES